MDYMVRTMASQTTATLPEVFRMASLTPAERAGIADRTGSLESGKTADILVLDDTLNVRRIFLGSQEFEP
jgi:N-acetylglucosamine-6-phosphate deacetylase